MAEGAEVGEVEDLGEAVVEGLASGAVSHAGETLEFGGGEFVEEAGEGPKLGGGEAARFFSWSVSAMMLAMRRAMRLWPASGFAAFSKPYHTDSAAAVTRSTQSGL